MPVFLLLFLSQILFTCSDFVARSAMSKYGFHLAAFQASWFILYLALRLTAMFGQLYIFANFSLGKTALLFAATSIVLSNLLGLLFLGEIITIPVYIAGFLVILALVILMFQY